MWQYLSAMEKVTLPREKFLTPEEIEELTDEELVVSNLPLYFSFVILLFSVWGIPLSRLVLEKPLVCHEIQWISPPSSSSSGYLSLFSSPSQSFFSSVNVWKVFWRWVPGERKGQMFWRAPPMCIPPTISLYFHVGYQRQTELEPTIHQKQRVQVTLSLFLPPLLSQLRWKRCWFEWRRARFLHNLGRYLACTVTQIALFFNTHPFWKKIYSLCKRVSVNVMVWSGRHELFLSCSKVKFVTQTVFKGKHGFEVDNNFWRKNRFRVFWTWRRRYFFSCLSCSSSLCLFLFPLVNSQTLNFCVFFLSTNQSFFTQNTHFEEKNCCPHTWRVPINVMVSFGSFFVFLYTCGVF